MLTASAPPATERLTTLLTTFGVTTAADEIVPRLTQAGHQEAVPVLVEVFDAEAEARRQRRIARLRRVSRLPLGRPSRRSIPGACPCRSCSGCRSSPQAPFSTRRRMFSRSGCRESAKVTPSVPWRTR